MGTDLVAESTEARRLFEMADSITGLPITRLCAEGPLERLTSTDVAQPAVVVTSLAASEVLRAATSLEFGAVAGHSVGEYAAYVAADVLDPSSALSLVNARARAMAHACAAIDGSMAAVIGLDEGPLRVACLAASVDGSSVEVANINAPGNLIVSGERAAIDRLGERARKAGAKRVLPLNVGGPFHSRYMRPAADDLGRALDDLVLRPGRIPVVVNSTADAVLGPEALRSELAVQVYSPVRWVASLQRLAQLGCDRFLEVGPGGVLAGLVRRTLPEVHVASFGSLADLPAARALVEA
jgi:[acyl-carrier-protein] S-malonyltransferase